MNNYDLCDEYFTKYALCENFRDYNNLLKEIIEDIKKDRLKLVAGNVFYKCFESINTLYQFHIIDSTLYDDLCYNLISDITDDIERYMKMKEGEKHE